MEYCKNCQESQFKAVIQQFQMLSVKNARVKVKLEDCGFYGVDFYVKLALEKEQLEINKIACKMHLKLRKCDLKLKIEIVKFK